MTQPLMDRDETLSERASRRIRGALAENRISQTALAQLMRMPQQKVSRKVNGITPLLLDDAELFAWALQVDVDAILGVGAFLDRPIGICELRVSDTRPEGRTRGYQALVVSLDQRRTRPVLRLVRSAS